MRSAILVLVILAAAPARAEEGAPKEKPAPAPKAAPAAKIPAPPFPWLASYAKGPTSEAMFTELRKRLFRTEKDADLIRGASWLVHAPQQEVRVAVGRLLADAYLLGDHLGADPVPALRTLARDPDDFVRSYMLSALAMHDSPLARELFLKHHTGEIPTPKGKAGEKIRRELAQKLPRFAGAKELEALKTADKKAQAAWIDLADDRPATKTEHGFETGVVRLGRDHGVLLESAPGMLLWAGGLRTVYGARGWVGSGDHFMVWLEPKAGGKSGGGGATPYGGMISGTGAGGSLIQRARYLGKDRVRYWVRVDAAGRALKHHRRNRKP